jgi:DHA1 family bicyclomycin/chloramphenicol resistance-like MFS transporter
VFSFAAWWRLPETHPAAARIPFSGRNLVATSGTVLRHPEFLMLALAAAVNFSSIACFIGSAPAIIERHWHLGETDYWQLFLPVIGGILTGAIISTRVAGRMDLLQQVRVGFGVTFCAAAFRVLMHLALADPPRGLQQAVLYVGAIGAQFAFPVLTLRMLDLFPAARGTAAAAQSFVALVFTALTLGIISPIVLPKLEWIAWTALACTSLASVFWYLARRWHDRTIPHASPQP